MAAEIALAAAFLLAGAALASPLPSPQNDYPSPSTTTIAATSSSSGGSSTAALTTNRFVSPIDSNLAVPSSLASLFPSGGSGGDTSGVNLGMVIPVAVLVPIFFVFGSAIIWKHKASTWRAKWTERRRRRSGMVRTESMDPEMAQREGTPATTAGNTPGQSNGRGGGHNANRSHRNRNPSIRTVPEYSADANDTEIVLARTQRSPSIPSTVESSGAATAPYDPDADEDRHLMRRSSSALVGNSSREFIEVPLAVPGTESPDASSADSEPREPPPDYQDSHEATTRRTSTVSMPEPGELSIAQTATMSLTDVSSTGDDAAASVSASAAPRSAIRSWFRGHANSSASSLLPTTMTTRSGRPPSAFRTRHQRKEPSSSSLLPSSTANAAAAAGRPRAGSSASVLTISGPVPDSFAQGAYGYPTASGYRPTPEQMRFLGSMDELNRVGAGPFSASRTSLSLARSRSSIDVVEPGVDHPARPSSDGPPPPPFEDAPLEGARHRSASEVSRAPLRMPAYPQDAPTGPASIEAATE